MGDRVAVAVEVPGLKIEFAGGSSLYEEIVMGLVAPVARGAWRPVTTVSGGAFPGTPLPAALAAARDPAPPAADLPAPASPARVPEPVRSFAAPPAPPSPPAPAPSRPAGSGPAFDFSPLYAILAREEGRRAGKDAVLLALVAMAAAGKRDASPAEIAAHLEAGGFPAGDLRPRPILAKLSHRKGLAVPGLLPGTYRATPAGVTYILRRARGA